MNKLTKAAKAAKREVVRLALERTQGMDMTALMDMAPLGEKIEEPHYDDIKETLNIPYMNREEIPLAMDTFMPIVPDDVELPVIVTIHGGGLTLGDRGISRPFGRLLAHKGYVVCSVEYRLAPRANVVQELDDVCAGMDLVARHLVDINVDFNRIFLVAESAGAYLAAYVAAMRQSKKLQEAIGRKPTRLVFRALALNCGMFYTNRNDLCGWMLSDQIYGERRTDENFMQYMNPEHPEIINNLPPVQLSTSRGDFLNNYSMMLHKALKSVGKTSHLVYYPDKDLSHAFLTLQTHHPTTLAYVDKMLAWLEEQARLDTDHKRSYELEERRQELEKRFKGGKINKQNVWRYIQETTAVDPGKLTDTAIVDCTREYTYEEMFREWEAYARVFTALGMNDTNESRVGIAGAICAEPLFAFYGLNMTGAAVSMLSYPDVLPTGQWKTMLQKEKITDLIITDIMVTPELWKEIQKVRKELGLRNVILLHSQLGGPCVGPAELIYNEVNAHALRQKPGAVFMDNLLKEYKNSPIEYAADNAKRITLIAHTSGTTKGTRKPLPYTNQALNTVASNHKDDYAAISSQGRVRIAPCFDFSSFLCMNFANHAFATGNTVVLTFFGFLHPKFIRAVGYYHLDVLFTSGFMFDAWMQREDLEDVDFSTLKVLSCGGSYIPPDKLKKYTEFARSHGYRYSIQRGYAMSETGGVQLVIPQDCEEDILGFPQPKNAFRIQDENDQKFYTVDDGVRTGTMYIASDSLCLNQLDGEVLFEYTKIGRQNFICTNDLVRVNEDGSLSYAGRLDRYFVNNEGVRFDPGLVEVQMAAQPAVDRCAVVPVLDKRIHDTVPVLYVIPVEKDEKTVKRIRQALVEVFVRSGKIARNNLPSQLVLVDDIPCNSNGKIDIFRITRDRLKGQAYNIVPVQEEGKLVNIQLKLAPQLDSIRAGSLPEGMGEGAPLGIFDLLNAPKESCSLLSFALTKLPFLKKKAKKDQKEKTMAQPPAAMMEFAQNMTGKLFGQQSFDHYFEG